MSAFFYVNKDVLYLDFIMSQGLTQPMNAKVSHSLDLLFFDLSNYMKHLNSTFDV